MTKVNLSDLPADIAAKMRPMGHSVPVISHHEPKKRPRHVGLVMVGAAAVSIAVLFGMAWIGWEMNPPSEIERKCVSKPITQLNMCIWRLRHGLTVD